jgi:uncharacterized tellurite resistance protein B-like protein
MIVPIFLLLLYLFYKIFDSSKNTSSDKRLDDLNDIDIPPSNNYTTPIQKIKSSHILEKEDTSDLFEFKISTNFDDEVKSNNQIKGKWINPSEVIQISSFKISKGFFYYGGQLKAINGYETDASLVDGSLSINYSISVDVDDLGYWPKYNSLSKNARGRYLNWLSSERNDLNTPIGYIFLYFYGIERRILVDYQKKQVSDDECLELYNELVRLRKIYGSNKSFYNYATNLIEYLSIAVPHVIKINDSEIEHSIYSQLFKYRLALAVKENRPISPQLALIWIKSNPNYKLKTPAVRCENEFDALFIKEYQNKFDEGMIVKPNKTKLKLNYYPASSTLRGIELKDLNLPDITVLKSPFNSLVMIVEKCIDKLDSYSRYVGRLNQSKDDLEAIMLLPTELLEDSPPPIFLKMKQWSQDVISSGGLTDVVDFWKQLDKQIPNSITKKDMNFMNNFFEKIGVGMVPDIRYHYAKVEPDGKMVLFQEGHGQYFEPSKLFHEIGMILRLGAMVAISDNNIHMAEVNILKKLIDHNTNLQPVEKVSLHSYLLWRLNSKINMNGLKANLSNLNMEEKKTISNILLSISLADGIINPAEIIQLKKLYKALGLDNSTVERELHQLKSSKLNQVDLSNQYEHILKEETKDDTFQLNNELLKLHELETNSVQNILDNIFIEDEDIKDENHEIQNITIEENNDVSNDIGLDIDHLILFNYLVSKNEWTEKEVQKFCEELDLMKDGAIETINDWSYELVDAPVIEEDENIFIDYEIVEEIKELTKGML